MTIVIPAADLVPDSGNLLNALLYSISLWAHIPEVLVCFDGCKPEFVHTFNTQYPFIRPLVNRGNRLNFAGNANKGLRYAHQVLKTSAVVVNQDCVLPDWPYFQAINGAGVCVPSSVSTCPEPPITDQDVQGLNNSQPEQILRTPHKKLVGFCMFLSSKLMDKIGYFDESFKATFEDDDICARALLAGFPVEHVNINVQHYGSRCGSYDVQRLGINLLKFRAKWQIPDGIAHGDFNDWISKNHTWCDDMAER